MRDQRLKFIDSLLRSRTKYYTKADLIDLCNEKFGSTSERTIEYDLKKLRDEYHVDIPEGQGNKNYTSDSIAFTEVDLTQEDHDALDFAYNLLKQYKGVEVFDSILRSLQKISKENGHEPDDSFDRVISFENRLMKRGREHLLKLYQAIIRKKIIKFQYKPSYKNDTGELRMFCPYYLKETNGMWYLLGHKPDESVIKTYALDRITKLELTEKDFTPDINFNPEEYFQFIYGISVPANVKNPTAITLRFERSLGEFLLSRPLHPTQTLLNSNDKTITLKLTLIFDENDPIASRELVRDIMKYSGDVEVLGPEGLKRLVGG